MMDMGEPLMLWGVDAFGEVGEQVSAPIQVERGFGFFERPKPRRRIEERDEEAVLVAIVMH